MSQTVSINGVNYTVPDVDDESWGQNVTDYLVAIAAGLLQKAGGTFTLTAEVDFGATYGLKSAYYKSRAANPASAGQVRLGNTETIKWRNAANDGDLALTVDAGDRLDFNGENIPSQSEMDAKLTDPMTTNGDIIVQTGGVPARLAAGGDGLVLTMVSGAPAWNSVAGTGDVVGPSSSVDNEIARFNSTTGKLLQTGASKMADGGAFIHKRTATAVSASTAGESYVGVTDTSAARTITLSDTDKVAGQTITIKDESGAAQTNNITVSPQSGTLDGESSKVIAKNYGSLTVYSDGSDWFTVWRDSVFTFETAYFNTAQIQANNYDVSYTSGSPIITTTDDFTTGGLVVGMRTVLAAFPYGAKVLSIDSATQLTMDANATSTGGPVANSDFYDDRAQVLKSGSARLHKVIANFPAGTAVETVLRFYDLNAVPDRSTDGASIITKCYIDGNANGGPSMYVWDFGDGIVCTNGLAMDTSNEFNDDDGTIINSDDYIAQSLNVSFTVFYS